ncbi:MAG TPA: membrane protein insertase YidC [Candidatus Dormibacteraeota bacterium]|nr:membrane protein insertase YidC [Candidatus Dormibacteraeota bacterium]
MMDRNTVLAIVLSAAVLLLWMALFPQQPPHPTPEPPGAAQPASTDKTGTSSTPPPGASRTPGPGDSTPSLSALGGVAGPPAAVPDVPPGKRLEAAAEEEIAIDTPLVAIHLTNRGARVTSWQLKKYLDDAGHPLELVSRAGRSLDHLPLQFLLDDPDATDRLKKALFRVSRREGQEDGHDFTEIALAWSDGQGLAATKTLRVRRDSYLADLKFAAEAGGKGIEPTLVWGAGFGAHNGQESGRYADTSWGVFDSPGLKSPQKRPQASLKPGQPWLEEGAVAWAGVEDKYFAAVFVPPGPEPRRGSARFELLRLVEDGVEQFHLSMAIGVPGDSEMRLFVGPKDYDILKGLGIGLDRLLDFGFFGVVALPLFYAMKVLQRYIGNYGWAIVLLTVVFRVLFFPLLYRGQIKMRVMQEKMKRVQPKVKAMRERYHRLEKKEAERGNVGARQKLRQEMNEELMKLYKEEDINPLGSMSGCLPLLLQLPILYAFYTILSISIELRHAPFMLWIKDLSQKDPYYVTPIIMGATQLVQQVMTSSSIPDPAQRRMMYLMPIMFTYIFLNFPSGLVLYWLVNNLLGIAQQYLINRQAVNDKAAA